MQYRRLGKTGLRVSVVGVGTWQFGGEWGKTFTQTEVDALFDAARAAGINLLDTAECYGDHESERFVGAALQRDRAKWVVATKFGHHFNKPFDRSEPRRPEDCLKQLEDSLVALRTDYVDLQQYHSWGDAQFFDDDVLAVMLKAKDQGKVRHLGNSVGSNTNVKQIAASRDRSIEFIQIIYNRLDRGPETTTFPICVEQDLGVLARVPLASGYLSGKYKPGHRFDANEVRGKWHKPEDTDRKLAEVEQIRREELPAGVDMATWALAWCLKHEAVTCVIPGCKDADQVKRNAAAAELADLVRADHAQAWKSA
jgi:aryl-alcohol dehydrogenase-like predicted oxidoreductase